MISNVALQGSEPAGAVPAAVETGDTGAFEALLALQSVANSLVANDAEADLLADALEDPVDDSDDDAESADDALWFISALLPAPKAFPANTAAGSAAAQHNQVSPVDVGAISLIATRSAADIDLPQIQLDDDSAGKDMELPVFASLNTAVSPPADTPWNSLSGTAELFAQGARHATAARVESAPLTSHVHDPRWADELGNRLAMMVRTGESSASLQLTPVDLGPLEVNVAVRDNQATVHFGAANAETRALLEASIPRLREMLEAQGFSLMDSSVSHGFAKSARHEAAGTPRVDEVGEAPTIAARATYSIGLLDLYA
ncbi:MAG TPA: flagellar hook-length control protein FliK [Steroidobacteraceae bacterium]|nr:flagellar hook-length control protein FliK [Steroidobacteraceae bacterium]